MKKRLFTLCTLMLCFAFFTAVLCGASAGDTAPIAENLSFETYRGVSFGGELTAHAPDGGELRFEITTKPTKGDIDLKDDGSFVYTPAESKKGRDYFGYRAVDSQGRRSQEATVIIRLVKCQSAVRYEDMQGHASEYSAVKLCECGAFTGMSIGGHYYFEPDAKMTRGEFLSLCLEITDTKLLSGVISTGFTDDSSIPAYLKPYVSTAVLNGVISGKISDGSSVFDADEPISRAEAMVILNNALMLSDVSYISVDEGVPEWAVQSAANLSACDIISDTELSTDALTRAECADMLTGAMRHLGA